MDTEMTQQDFSARLKRLDASAQPVSPSFGYDAMFARREQRETAARRRAHAASATATMLVVAFVSASIWRIDARPDEVAPTGTATVAAANASVSNGEPRLVRADTYLAVAALEDHIASVDDALSVARAYAPRGGEVARLEHMRAELMDSYAQVRYAEMVSANF
jgi:hypothetical protein